MKRLFAASISCTYDDGKQWAIKNVQPVSRANLWWDPKSPKQATLFQSTVTLGEEFFKEAIRGYNPMLHDLEKQANNLIMILQSKFNSLEFCISIS